MQPRSLLARLAGGLAMALSAATLMGGGGCELAVPDAIPVFLCEPGPGSCPSSDICAPSTHRCVPQPQSCTVGGCPANMECDPGTLACVPVDSSVAPADASSGEEAAVAEAGGGGDAPTVDADAASMDALPDVTGADDSAASDASAADGMVRCHGTIGCACTVAHDCNSGLCVTQEGSVTRDIWDDAHRRAFCSKTCCTSSDCDPGSVCFATAAGGNYCVLASWLGDRSPTPGGKVGGEECFLGSECRSGLCVSGACTDTCCSGRSGNQCGPGSACRFGDFQGMGFDQHHTASCAPVLATGSPTGTDCTSNGACRSNLCVNAGNGFVTCHDACRSAGDCAGANQACSYIATPGTGDVFAACIWSGMPGNVALQGSNCRGASDCQSGLCDSSGQCTDVCFSDSDCTFGGWHCRPAAMPILGGGTGTYWVLTCGS